VAKSMVKVMFGEVYLL